MTIINRMNAWFASNPKSTVKWIGLMEGAPADKTEAENVERAAMEIAQDANVPDFGAFFLARHPRFKTFPPIGWLPGSEVHEAIFDTLTAYARHVKDVVWGVH